MMMESDKVQGRSEINRLGRAGTDNEVDCRCPCLHDPGDRTHDMWPPTLSFQLNDWVRTWLGWDYVAVDLSCEHDRLLLDRHDGTYPKFQDEHGGIVRDRAWVPCCDQRRLREPYPLSVERGETRLRREPQFKPLKSFGFVPSKPREASRRRSAPNFALDRTSGGEGTTNRGHSIAGPFLLNVTRTTRSLGIQVSYVLYCSVMQTLTPLVVVPLSRLKFSSTPHRLRPSVGDVMYLVGHSIELCIHKAVGCRRLSNFFVHIQRIQHTMYSTCLRRNRYELASPERLPSLTKHSLGALPPRIVPSVVASMTSTSLTPSPIAHPNDNAARRCPPIRAAYPTWLAGLVVSVIRTAPLIPFYLPIDARQSNGVFPRPPRHQAYDVDEA
ncbi:hypothetical protein ACRALDRAFT_210910 [Sodiomyces alcalophilus JCM 7366]|uniref:uncharacterized protein n=1 Tax=Sodiomyces alcalophilus JCM 7366 TaxID=591952 RepID=UPI0039B3B176